MKFEFFKKKPALENIFPKIAFSHLVSTLECLPIPASVTKMSCGKYLYANEPLLKLLNIDKKALLGGDSLSLGVWGSENERKDFVASLYAGLKTANIRVKHPRKDPNISAHIYSSAVECGEETLCVSCVFDITDAARAEFELNLIKTRFRELMGALNEAYFVCDMEGRFKRANSACCAMLGYSELELLDMTIDSLSTTKISDRGKKIMIEQLIDSGATNPMSEEWNARGRGTIRVETKRFIIRGENGEPAGFWGIAANISDRVSTQKQDAYPAYHDLITELPNRAWLIDRLRRTITRARISGETLMIFYIDIADFAKVNDEYGMRAGDLLLKDVSKRIESALRSTDLIARVGMDEFAIVMGSQPTDKLAMSLLRRLIRFFSQPFSVNDALVNISLHIGVALFPGDSFDADSLIGEAESAMRKASSIDPLKTSFFFASGELNEIARVKINMENVFLASFSAKAIFARYMPVMRLEDGKLRFVAVEALARWRHPDLGEMIPARFLEIADDLGVTADIDRAIFEIVINDLERWIKDGWDKKIAINLSRQTLEDSSFSKWAYNQVSIKNIDPRLISFDISSALLFEKNRTIGLSIQRLREEGFGVNADGFGSELAFIAEFARMGIGEVKISPSDLRMISGNERASNLLVVIEERLKLMGIKMSILGIETINDNRIASESNASFLSGFYYSEPLDSSGIEEFARARK